MFNKKECQRCGRKTSKNNSFCPTCGTPLKRGQNREEFGMLGEDDSFNEVESFSNSLFGGMGGFGGISGGFMNKMISNTMKMLEKEMEKEMQGKGTKPQNQNNNAFPRTKIRLMVNGKEINLNNGTGETQNNERKEVQKMIKFKKFSEEQIKRFSKLPKKQPKTDLKRIADKISYEIEIPEVDSIEDVSITHLENSIEMKAIAKDKAYSKSIPINLPIVDYAFSKGLLVLEFKGN
ncbi:MAG: zinc ribbon domain-containing protein [Candidatus Pacearchaeota archaeon]|nr:zinc ribbon domain-containing protein [Candidatus Pacearchaeota archaeon]